ncbi:M48 family metallopeptidase [Vibrio sp. SCSIO 43136]|uniref:M48 family metallopeptidase n=1 Tax=Vibrio sp. SCSIO 43136 TaxID=2819101 RepID=UPI0020752799|nr:M48 family metallopeptidase [Vibrio sp. SCSIO 43136]USD66772.1 M48 family metallopeptidase [Vibrio sp. SCSIO 43136]
MPIKRTIFCMTIVSLIAACTTSPTGRKQLIMFSDNDMAALGAQSFEQIKQEQKISKDKKINQYVQCVSDAITKHVGSQPGFKAWEVVVFDSDQVNAFALPGGKIGVYTGLLNVAQNQDQLATVIGHEVAHVLADHSNERLSNSQLAAVGMQVGNVAIKDTQYHDSAMAALGLGLQYGVILPYGRTQESEADIIGLQLMAKAGFDPAQSVELWKNMARASGGNQPPEFFSTHPSHSTRINDLSTTMTRLPKSKISKPNCQ